MDPLTITYRWRSGKGVRQWAAPALRARAGRLSILSSRSLNALLSHSPIHPRSTQHTATHLLIFSLYLITNSLLSTLSPPHSTQPHTQHTRARAGAPVVARGRRAPTDAAARGRRGRHAPAVAAARGRRAPSVAAARGRSHGTPSTASPPPRPDPPPCCRPSATTPPPTTSSCRQNADLLPLLSSDADGDELIRIDGRPHQPHQREMRCRPAATASGALRVNLIGSISKLSTGMHRRGESAGCIHLTEQRHKRCSGRHHREEEEKE